ncbi:Na(+)/H(+) exchange regulatory cofactor NHE-RF3 [Gastrophryne carolinensis]
MVSTAQPRECTLTKQEGKGYGFFLRVEKDIIGHLVRAIEKDSPAEKAGFQDGDRLLKVNGLFVDDKEHPEVVDLIKASGSTVTLSVLDEVSYLNAKKNGTDLSGKILSESNKSTATKPSESTAPKPSESSSPKPSESSSPKPSESSSPKPSESSSPKPSESSSPKPRLCYLVKDKGSFGFSLKCVKGASGVFLESLAEGGVAFKAGIQAEDRLIEVNGKNVESLPYDQIVALVRESGEAVMFLVVDKATDDHFKQQKKKITADQATTRLLPNPPRIVQLTKGSDGYGFYLRQEKNRKGHFIVEIDPQSPADKAKLKDFDRVVAVNGESVEQMQHEQVVEVIRKGGNSTTLLVSDKTTDDLYAKAGLSPFVYLKESQAPAPVNTEAAEPPTTKPAPPPAQPAAPTPVTPPPQYSAATLFPAPEHKPRLCRVQKGDKGFGFNLNAIKDVPGQYFKQIVKGGPADLAGIKEDDVLVEVSGINVEKESYEDTVMRIKQAGGTVTLLVVSKEGSEYYKSQKIQITASMAEPLPESNSTANANQNPPPSKARSAPEPIEMENQTEAQEEPKIQDDDTAL